MNLYIRYFNDETVVHSAHAAIEFLSSIPEIECDEFLQKNIIQYAESAIAFPKRYKVRGKNYFIVIKTTAETLAEFKANGGRPTEEKNVISQRKEEEMNQIKAYRPGWYNAGLLFQRAVTTPEGKCLFVETDFRVRLKAMSIQDCYDRIVEHIRNRQDIDPRSQIPSVKGRNFSYQYLGLN